MGRVAENSKHVIESLLSSYANGVIEYYRTKLSSGYSILYMVEEAKEFDDLPLLSRLIKKEFPNYFSYFQNAKEALKC